MRTRQLKTQIDDTPSYEAIVDSCLTCLYTFIAAIYIYIYVGECIYALLFSLFVSHKGQNS